MFNVAPQRLCSLLLVNRIFPRSMNTSMVKFSFRLRNYWLEFGIYPTLGFLPYFMARILKLVEKQIYLILVSRLSGCVCKVKKWRKEVFKSVNEFFTFEPPLRTMLCNLNSSLTLRELDANISLSLTSCLLPLVCSRCGRVCWRRLLQPGLYQHRGGVPVLVRSGLRASTWQAQLQSSG